jgi:hypothetical protein
MFLFFTNCHLDRAREGMCESAKERSSTTYKLPHIFVRKHRLFYTRHCEVRSNPRLSRAAWRVLNCAVEQRRRGI